MRQPRKSRPSIADVIGDVVLVLVVSSLLGGAARRCGQPSVVGQILAGILLGPNLLGLWGSITGSGLGGLPGWDHR
jgi:Kef-type K+ transport system membrane component KefB